MSALRLKISGECAYECHCTADGERVYDQSAHYGKLLDEFFGEFECLCAGTSQYSGRMGEWRIV